MKDTRNAMYGILHPLHSTPVLSFTHNPNSNAPVWATLAIIALGWRSAMTPPALWVV